MRIQERRGQKCEDSIADVDGKWGGIYTKVGLEGKSKQNVAQQ